MRSFKTPHGEFIFASFVTQDHFTDTRQALAEAGVSLKPLVDEDGSVLPVRKLAIARTHPSAPVWRNVVSRLYEDVEIVRSGIKSAGYGFCSFGVATPNLDYEGPVVTRDPDGRASASHSKFDGNEFNFLREDQLKERHWPIALDDPRSSVAVNGLAVVLQYREGF